MTCAKHCVWVRASLSWKPAAWSRFFLRKIFCDRVIRWPRPTYELFGTDWNPKQIEARHEPLTLPFAESRTGAGTHAGASLAGGSFDTTRGADRYTFGHTECALAGVEQAGAGDREHNSDDSESGSLRILAAGALARRPRRSPGDSGADSLRAAARHPQHLHGNPRSRSCRGGSRARHGTNRPATPVPSRIAAGAERDSIRGASRGRGFGGTGDHRCRDRSGRFGRIHVSWSC